MRGAGPARESGVGGSLEPQEAAQGWARGAQLEKVRAVLGPQRRVLHPFCCYSTNCKEPEREVGCPYPLPAGPHLQRIPGSPACRTGLPIRENSGSLLFANSASLLEGPKRILGQGRGGSAQPDHFAAHRIITAPHPAAPRGTRRSNRQRVYIEKPYAVLPAVSAPHERSAGFQSERCAWVS